jgi:hypothetical protein
MSLFYNKQEDDMRKNAEQAKQEAIKASFRGANGGLYGDALRAYEKPYEDYANQAADELAATVKKNRYFGDGIIGAVLNPWAQTFDVLGDVATGQIGSRYNRENPMLKNVGMSNWKGSRKQNDLLSDIGAVGEAAFDAVGMGALGDAVKGGSKLMSNVGKTALRTGALGAGENAFSALREGGRDTRLGDIALSGAIGGAFGSGLGAVSQIGGNAANIAKQVRSPQMQALNGYYQQALAGRAQPLNPSRMLGDGVGGASVGTAGNYLDWVPNSAKAAMERSGTPLAKTGLGRVAQGIADSRAIYGSPLSTIANSRLGQTTKNILKTPYGKIGAGVGGGLLLANLLRGNGQPAQEMSDAELEQLMNYYNGGY